MVKKAASADSGPQKSLQPASPAAELTLAELRGELPVSPDELAKVPERAGAADELVGQQRALDAIRMAIGVDGSGYNVFVSGLRSRNERDTIVRLLQQKAASMPTPGDWVYVNNFKNPEAPTAIYLPSGHGGELRDQMQKLVTFVREQLPKSFRREDFEHERAALRDKYNKRGQELLSNIEARARERGFGVQSTPAGLVFVPLVGGKMPESPEDLQRQLSELPEHERERLAQAQQELQNELGSLMLRQQEMMHELIEDIRAIERSFAARLIGPAVAALKKRFSIPAVDAYLDDVEEHMLSHLELFRETGHEGRPEPVPRMEGDGRFVDYQVNVLVDNWGRRGAPVVCEDAPGYRNLFGTIERWIDPMGRSFANFTRIMSGSFLKSHGGFLVFDLEDAIVEPGVWRTLKRILKTGRMTIETFEPLPFFSGSGLRPEPLEIRNKVVVLGGALLYSLLYFYDADFAELFKVKAEIRPVIGAEPQAVRAYAERLLELARREKLPRFDRGAIGRIVQFGMRLAGDRQRLLAVMEPIEDLARESAYFARLDGFGEVGAAQVERALNERILRLNFIEEEVRRLIANGVLVVRIEGKAIAQVNALAVLDVGGGYAFGRPSRVTATVSLGQAGVINIEREARLSGSTHDKGVMILSGFLRWRFGLRQPLAMSASIAFEQSYSGVDGDSASSTELYALLSALSGVPLRQDLAVTGSVDQHGRVQAIGGVNEKVEGFYRVCKTVGLTGTQGVLIPRVNIGNLILEEETAGAVEAGRFHIYPVESVDQGIEILTGVRAGTIDEPGTVNFLVAKRLREMSEALQKVAGRETHVVHEPAASPPPPTPPPPPGPPR